MDSKKNELKNNNNEIESQEKSFYTLIFIGDSKVGKTQIINIYTKKYFQNKYFPTFGINFQLKKIYKNGKNIYIHCVDTQGTSDFSLDIDKNFMNNADAFIFVYDLSSRETLYNLNRYIEIVNNSLNDSNKNKIFYLTGNKSDLMFNKFSIQNDANEISNKYGAKNIVVSAKSNLNIDRLFEYIIQDINQRGNNNCSDSGGKIKKYFNTNKNENNFNKDEKQQENDSGLNYDTSSYFLKTSNVLKTSNNDLFKNNLNEEEANKLNPVEVKKNCIIF